MLSSRKCQRSNTLRYSKKAMHNVVISPPPQKCTNYEWGFGNTFKKRSCKITEVPFLTYHGQNRANHKIHHTEQQVFHLSVEWNISGFKRSVLWIHIPSQSEHHDNRPVFLNLSVKGCSHICCLRIQVVYFLKNLRTNGRSLPVLSSYVQQVRNYLNSLVPCRTRQDTINSFFNLQCFQKSIFIKFIFFIKTLQLQGILKTQSILIEYFIKMPGIEVSRPVCSSEKFRVAL